MIIDGHLVHNIIQQIIRAIYMELGLAVGVFFIVAIILMALFCIVTRYFNYRLQKALQEQAEVYSLIEGIQGQRQDINQGQYQDFVHKRIEDRKKRQLEKDKNYQIMIEMTDMNMNEPLKINQVDIYGISKLKRRLGGDNVPIIVQSTRSLISHKTFKPQKLGAFRDPESFRSNMSKGQNENIQSIQRKKADIKIHKYISKIVSYTEDNLIIIQNNVQSLWKQTQNGDIKQKKSIRSIRIQSCELGFEDALQAYGFEKGIQGAFKFQITAQIIYMRPKQIYETKSLKKTEQKLEIQFPSFYYLKDKIQQKNEIDDKNKQQMAKQYLRDIENEKKAKKQIQNEKKRQMEQIKQKQRQEKDRLQKQKIQKEKQAQRQKKQKQALVKQSQQPQQYIPKTYNREQNFDDFDMNQEIKQNEVLNSNSKIEKDILPNFLKLLDSQ